MRYSYSNQGQRPFLLNRRISGKKGHASNEEEEKGVLLNSPDILSQGAYSCLLRE
jgi:hypothetical protein